MITEDYVSFETAKLLKEKGFDEKCFQYWHEDDNELVHSQSMHPIQNVSNPCFFGPAAPTLHVAMKWLRENHNLYVTSVPNGIGEDVFYMGIYRKYDYGWTYISDGLDEEYKEAEFSSPEEACEAAIKYCLENLI